MQKIVFEFDPLVDLIVKHDEAYDALMTDFFMNSLSLVDEALTTKITAILSLERPEHRKLLVLLVKKFVHSLGFAFLNMRITLFVWDQLIMKVRRNQVEIFICLAIMFFCLKNKILDCENWDHVLNSIYGNAKNINFEEFYEKYQEIFEKMPFYASVYELPIEKKQLILSQKINKNPESDEQELVNEEEKILEEKYEKKSDFRPIVQKSHKSKMIQPKFINKSAKSEENNVVNYEINEKEMLENLLVEKDEKNEDQQFAGLLPNVKQQMRKNDILEGFEQKKKKKNEK